MNIITTLRDFELKFNRILKCLYRNNYYFKIIGKIKNKWFNNGIFVTTTNDYVLVNKNDLKNLLEYNKNCEKELNKYKELVETKKVIPLKEKDLTVRQRPLNRQEVMERNQARVLALYLKGYKPKDIVNELQISQATVYRALGLEKVEIERLHNKYVNEFAGVDYSLVKDLISLKAQKNKNNR